MIRWLALAIALLATPTWALTPQRPPKPPWEQSDEASRQVVDQQPWSRFLSTYIRRGADGVNRVAYAEVTLADRSVLEKDLERLAEVRVSALNRVEQQAYWINLYNQLTILVVLRHWPVASMTDLGMPWDRPLIQVEGISLSLNEIERGVLHQLWRDPRTHYAINSASIGSPNLLTKPWTAANMEAKLNQATRAYVNSPRGAYIRDGQLTVSKIYEWYRRDFGGSDESILAHLRQYARPSLAKALDSITIVSAYAYDWDLNVAPAKAR